MAELPMIQFTLVLPMIRWSFGWFCLPMIRWSFWWFCLPMIRWSNFGFFVEYYRRSDDHISVFLPKFTDDPMIIFRFFCRKLPTIRWSHFGFFRIFCWGSRHFWFSISFAGFCFSWFNAIIFCAILAIQPVDYDDEVGISYRMYNEV